MPRHASNPGWYGPASQWWNVLGDYEGATFEMGVSDYTFDGTTAYEYTGTTSIYRHAWLTSNGNEYFSTTYMFNDGSTQSDSNAFAYTPERRSYSCSVYNPYMGNFTMTNTKFWIRHTVNRWPTSQAELSPGTGSADLYFVYNTLTSGCTGSTQQDLELFSSAPYSKNTIVLNAKSIPINNVEIVLYVAGKNF